MSEKIVRILGGIKKLAVLEVVLGGVIAAASSLTALSVYNANLKTKDDRVKE